MDDTHIKIKIPKTELESFVLLTSARGIGE